MQINCSYAGPFVECKNLLINKAVTGFGCQNCNLVLWRDQPQDTRLPKFCSKCGAQNGLFVYSVFEPTIDASRIFEGVLPYDLYSTPRMSNEAYAGADYWIPNIKCKWDWDEIEDKILVTTPNVQDMQLDIQYFTALFQKHIEHLEAVYGTSNVSVKWGFLRWPDY